MEVPEPLGTGHWDPEVPPVCTLYQSCGPGVLFVRSKLLLVGGAPRKPQEQQLVYFPWYKREGGRKIRSHEPF